MSYREAFAAHLELTGVLKHVDRLLASGATREVDARVRAAQQVIDVVRQRAGSLERPTATDPDWSEGRRRGVQVALRIVLRTPDTGQAAWLGDTRQALIAATREAALERAERAREDTPIPTHGQPSRQDKTGT